jgi:hypothetical protein
MPMLFPQLAPEYYQEDDKDILKRMEAFYAESITINQNFWGEGSIDTRFFSGDQSVYGDLGLYGNLPANRRRTFNFNRIRRVVNMISGHQRRSRKSIIAVPVESSDNQTADQLTKVLMWNCRQENILETISEAFEGALVTGMNLLHLYVDYRKDPVAGQIKVNNCSYNEFLIDPFFRKHDLSDCNGIWKRTYLTKKEVLSLLPDHANEISTMIGNPYGGSRDAKFQFMPESYNYTMKNLLTYDQFYYRDFRHQKMLVDTQSGETFEWKSNDEDALKLFLQTYPSVTVIEQEVPSVKLAIVVQGKVFYNDYNPTGSDYYPFVPVLGYYHPQQPDYVNRIQGVVRGLRDAQFLYNRRKVAELDILESQINSGFIYKENALVNPADVFLTGQGRGLALKRDAQMSDVQKIEAPQIPPSMIQLSEILAREIQEISGVNEELLGSANDDKAGILSMLRQGAGLTTLQTLFDQLDMSQKLLGKQMIDLIQLNYTPGKIKRIIEEDPTREFYNKNFGTYDVAVEEGLNTSTQKQMQFAQMLQLRQAGVPISDIDLLEAATVQNKNKIIENTVRQQEASSQAQQAQAQSAAEFQAAQVRLADSQAQANLQLGAERQSRIQENFAQAQERLAEASKDDQQGLLNFVKALKELDNIDLMQLERLLSLQKLLKDTESSNMIKTSEDRGANLAQESNFLGVQ